MFSILLIRLLEPIFTWFYLKVINYRGTSQMQVIPDYDLNIDGVSVASVRGFKVSFYCQEVRYVLSYSRVKLIKEFKVYRLYAVCDDEAPPLLKKIITTDVYLPALVPVLVKHELRRRILLEAYMDILQDRLDKLRASEGFDDIDLERVSDSDFK